MKLLYALDKSPLNRDADVEQAVNTASALVQNGVDVTFAFPWHAQDAVLTPAGLRERYGLGDVPHLRPVLMKTRKPLFQQIAFDYWVLKTLSSLAPDILYTRKAEIAALAACCDVATALDQYKPLHFHPGFVQQILKWLLRRKQFKALFLHSQLASDGFEECGQPMDKIHVALNGLRLDPFGKQMNRAELDLGKGVIATYAGRIRRGKGLMSLLDLACANPDVHFLFIGADGVELEIETKIQSIANARLLPWMNMQRMRNYLGLSDILMLPPVDEPLRLAKNTVLPLKTYAYLSAGRAIFGPATPDVEEVLSDGVNARLVLPGQPQDAQHGFAELVASQALRDHLAAGARQAAQNLCWQKRGALIQSVLRNCLSNDALPQSVQRMGPA